MNKALLRLKSRVGAFSHDFLVIPIAWFGAYWLRFNLGWIPDDMFVTATNSLVIIAPLQIFFFWYFGLYRGVWRFASIPDLLRISKAVFFGVGISMVVLFAVTRLEGVPRSVPMIYAIMLAGFLSGSRFIYRWRKDYRRYYSSGKRVLIIGAGRAGEMLVRDLLGDSQHTYQPVAFVDDDPRKSGRDIHGIRVMGKRDDIRDIISKNDIDIVMLALPSAKKRQIRELVTICEDGGVPIRILPRLPDLVSGSVGLNELRDVSIEDLLGRDQITLDWDSIHSTLTNRTILISGAGGSIGSELCRQISKLQPSCLVLLDNSEFNLFTMEQELKLNFPDLELHVHLTNVVDSVAVMRVMECYKPQVVFHAAAYKHVPLLQGQIREAAQNNILGTKTIAQAASKYGVDQFVLISTDKAVNPANIMGASKRIAEIFCQNLSAKSSTRFITVRFGNVLGSAGSVVPLFKKQIKSGGPVTVTHAGMTRYFMTIPEACQLIMQSAVMGQGGEIFVLDMGKPVKITYLAEQMIRLSGKEPHQDIEIVYTGLRPGEKLYEELFHEKENLTSTNHNKILLSESRKMDWEKLDIVLDKIELACDQYDEVKLKQLIHDLVPEMYEEKHAGRIIPANVVSIDQSKAV